MQEQKPHSTLRTSALAQDPAFEFMMLVTCCQSTLGNKNKPLEKAEDSAFPSRGMSLCVTSTEVQVIWKQVCGSELIAELQEHLARYYYTDVGDDKMSMPPPSPMDNSFLNMW